MTFPFFNSTIGIRSGLSREINASDIETAHLAVASSSLLEEGTESLLAAITRVSETLYATEDDLVTFGSFWVRHGDGQHTLGVKGVVE